MNSAELENKIKIDLYEIRYDHNDTSIGEIVQIVKYYMARAVTDNDYQDAIEDELDKNMEIK